MARNRESKSVPKVKLTRAEKKQLAAIMAQAQKKKGPQTAQQTIPYQRMWPDGICRVTDHYYTKTIQFFDINYQLAQNEDKEAIFEAWCDVLNYFSPDIRFQFSFVNTVASEAAFDHGCYEVDNRKFGRGTAEKAVSHFLEMLHDMKK